MKYTEEHLKTAKEKGWPMFKVEIDYRYVKASPTKRRQEWGAATPEEAEQLRQFLMRDYNDKP